jgi:hypothetical protein
VTYVFLASPPPRPRRLAFLEHLISADDVLGAESNNCMNQLPSFSKGDTDRILRRAAEIDGSEEAGPVSVEDLRSIASEAGFGAQAVERAIAEAQQAAVANIQRTPVQKSGIVWVFMSTTRTIPIELSSEQLMWAIRLFVPYREGPPQVKLEADRITWRERKGLRFTVTPGGGVTEISVVISRPLIRRGRMKGWIRDAADRLESLILMVAAQDQKTGAALLPPGI